MVVQNPDRRKRFGRVGSAESVEDFARSYDGWAENYEGDMLSLGYTVPAVAADFIGRHVPPNSKALDAGVGTGLLGDKLKTLGYRDLTGIDVSWRMMDVARRKGAYRELRRMTLGEPLDFPDASFDAVFAVSVFDEGHATPDSLDELLRVARPGGWLVFSVREDSFADGGFREKQEKFSGKGLWEPVRASEPFSTFPVADMPYRYRMFVYRKP